MADWNFQINMSEVNTQHNDTQHNNKLQHPEKMALRCNSDCNIESATLSMTTLSIKIHYNECQIGTFK